MEQANGYIQHIKTTSLANGSPKARVGKGNSTNSSPFSNGENRVVNEDDFYEDDDDLLTLPSTSVFVGVPMVGHLEMS